MQFIRLVLAYQQGCGETCLPHPIRGHLRPSNVRCLSRLLFDLSVAQGLGPTAYDFAVKVDGPRGVSTRPTALSVLDWKHVCKVCRLQTLLFPLVEVLIISS